MIKGCKSEKFRLEPSITLELSLLHSVSRQSVLAVVSERKQFATGVLVIAL